MADQHLLQHLSQSLAAHLKAPPSEPGASALDAPRQQIEHAHPHLTVALSGGMDSTVLLHALAQLRSEHAFDLSAAHVHHALSPNADHWAQHCAQLCGALQIPFELFHVQVQTSAHGLEASARKARYRALSTLTTDWIALAHHRGDQAETLLHRLVRGTGVEGASAMRACDPQRRLWRPLLGQSRQTLLAYAQTHGLQWIEDESNANPQYTRNLLRHRVLAPLNESIPQAEANMARAAAHFGQAAHLLGELAEIDLAALKIAQQGSRSALLSLSHARACNLLRHLLFQRNELAPEEARLLDILKQLRGHASAVHLPIGQSAFCAYRDAFWIESISAQPYTPVRWQGEKRLAWGEGYIEFTPSSGGAALRIQPDMALHLTTRQGGEHLRTHPKAPNRAFKQLCQEQSIAPWHREILPILRQGEHILWIGALGANSPDLCKEGEAGFELNWKHEGMLIKRA